ncbi:Nn.00g030900.m01.CDS01 [Neocucurbitaria sp. VM-36]
MGPSKHMSNQEKRFQQPRAESPSTESEIASVTDHGKAQDNGHSSAHNYEDPNLSWEWSSSKLDFKPRVAARQTERSASVQAPNFDQHQPYNGSESVPRDPAPAQFQYITLPSPQTTTYVVRQPQLSADVLRALQEHSIRFDSHADEIYGETHPLGSMTGGFANFRGYSNAGAESSERPSRRFSTLPIDRVCHNASRAREQRSIYEGANEITNGATDRNRRCVHSSAHAVANRMHSRELKNVFMDVLDSVAWMRAELRAIRSTMLKVGAAINFLDGEEAK